MPLAGDGVWGEDQYAGRAVREANFDAALNRLSKLDLYQHLLAEGEEAGGDCWCDMDTGA